MKNKQLTLSKLPLLAILISGATFSTLSFADDGFYVGGQLHNTTSTHSIERDTGTNTTPSITTTDEESEFSGGVKLGYKQHVNNDMFVVVEGFYNVEDAETTNINNLLRTKVDLKATYGINFKAGIDVTDKFSVHGIVGARALDFDIDNDYPFAPPTRSGSETEVGLAWGMGIGYDLVDNWSLTAEYVRMNDIDFDPLPEVAVPGKINDNELSYNSFSIGVNYTF